MMTTHLNPDNIGVWHNDLDEDPEVNGTVVPPVELWDIPIYAGLQKQVEGLTAENLKLSKQLEVERARREHFESRLIAAYDMLLAQTEFIQTTIMESTEVSVNDRNDGP